MWKNLFFAAMGMAFGAYICALGFIEISPANNAPAEQQTKQSNGKQSNPELRPTGHSADTNSNNATGEAKGSQKSAFHKVTDWITGFLFDLKITDVLLVFFTYVLADKTAGLFSETAGMRTAAEGQSKDMQASIREAGRAATAMEGVAKSMAANVEHVATTVATNREIADRQKLFGEAQMRAYLSVVIGAAVYQERERNLRFEAKPLIVNSGNTPAYKVHWSISSAIIPFSEINNFHFPLSTEIKGGNSVIGPRQDRILSAVVNGFVDDDEVENIKMGLDSALWVWGRVGYEDIFGRSHFTNFSHA